MLRTQRKQLEGAVTRDVHGGRTPTESSTYIKLLTLSPHLRPPWMHGYTEWILISSIFYVVLLFNRNAYNWLEPSVLEKIVMIGISEKEICSATKISWQRLMVRPREKMDPSDGFSINAPFCLSPAFPPPAMGSGNAEQSKERLATSTA